jgi:hypothetical protein
MSPAAELRSEFLMQVEAEFEAPQNVGETPLGTRRILHMRRGSFSGPRLQGEVLPGGGDWVLARRDGVAQLDIRFTLRANDGELIYASCGGLFDIEPKLRQRILEGEEIDPSSYYFRTALVFETGAPRYLWLNRLIAAGIGRRTAVGMATDVFAIR